ncbi:hypothetical protein GCM10027614_02000 [Micromonospora vulcania]
MSDVLRPPRTGVHADLTRGARFPEDHAMTDLVIRPLVAGEENLFDSMPDPLPQLRKVAYADGIAGGGYRPEHTWVALRAGRVVGRAAWLLPPGAVGAPWLEQFDLDAEPEVGAALLHVAHEALGGPTSYFAALPAHWRRRPEVLAVVRAPMAAARLAGLVEGKERLRCSWTGTPLPTTAGRYTFRTPIDAAEINALVARIADPEVLTGVEIARAVGGSTWPPTRWAGWRVRSRTGGSRWTPGSPSVWPERPGTPAIRSWRTSVCSTRPCEASCWSRRFGCWPPAAPAR